MCSRHAQSVVQEHLDSCHDHSRVGVAEPVIQNIHEVIHFLLPCGPVVTGKLQNLTLRPFRKVLHHNAWWALIKRLHTDHFGS